MSTSDKDLGVLTTLLARFEKERLPRALEIKARLVDGEKLSDVDLKYLERILGDAEEIKPYIERNPEYTKLAGNVMGLYNEITELALKNEDGD